MTVAASRCSVTSVVGGTWNGNVNTAKAKNVFPLVNLVWLVRCKTQHVPWIVKARAFFHYNLRDFQSYLQRIILCSVNKYSTLKVLRTKVWYSFRATTCPPKLSYGRATKLHQKTTVFQEAPKKLKGILDPEMFCRLEATITRTVRSPAPSNPHAKPGQQSQPQYLKYVCLLFMTMMSNGIRVFNDVSGVPIYGGSQN